MKNKLETDHLLDKYKKIHMIGIGGSGMCPIAEILHSWGYEITGSDNNESDIVNRIKKLGIKVSMGHRPENVEGAELVIYSAAIMQDNPEIVAAKILGIPTLERSFVLGALTRKYNNTIGVCGTHGKTTVTSMITQILFENDFSPTAVIGGKLPVINSYGIAGNSDIFVCESCEYIDTFLKLSPDTCVLLNIDRDHMEYFKTLENLQASFAKFAQSAKTVFLNKEDENSVKALENVTSEIITFGLTKDCDYFAANIDFNKRGAGSFDFYYNNELLTRIELSVPGKHNILNSLAAAATAHFNGATGEQIAKSIKNFKGAGRRFEILGEVNDITIVDDYAHHPKELEVTLSTAMKMGYERVIAVFQPFTFSRTSLLLNDFIEVLKIPDLAVLSEIMGSREINTYGIYSKDITSKVENAVNFETFEEIADHVASIAKPNDLIITLGCGDIYKCARMILKKLTKETQK